MTEILPEIKVLEDKNKARLFLSKITPLILVYEISKKSDLELEIKPNGCYYDLADICKCLTVNKPPYLPDNWEIYFNRIYGNIEIKKTVKKGSYTIEFEANISIPERSEKVGKTKLTRVYYPYIDYVSIYVYEGNNIRGEAWYSTDWRFQAKAPYMMFVPNYLNYGVFLRYNYELIPSSLSNGNGDVAVDDEVIVSHKDVQEFVDELTDVLPEFDPHCLLLFKSLLELYP